MSLLNREKPAAQHNTYIQQSIISSYIRKSGIFDMASLDVTLRAITVDVDDDDELKERDD